MSSQRVRVGLKLFGGGSYYCLTIRKLGIVSRDSEPPTTSAVDTTRWITTLYVVDSDFSTGFFFKISYRWLGINDWRLQIVKKIFSVCLQIIGTSYMQCWMYDNCNCTFCKQTKRPFLRFRIFNISVNLAKNLKIIWSNCL